MTFLRLSPADAQTLAASFTPAEARIIAAQIPDEVALRRAEFSGLGPMAIHPDALNHAHPIAPEQRIARALEAGWQPPPELAATLAARRATAPKPSKVAPPPSTGTRPEARLVALAQRSAGLLGAESAKKGSPNMATIAEVERMMRKCLTSITNSH